MNDDRSDRRDFLKKSAALAAGTALATLDAESIGASELWARPGTAPRPGARTSAEPVRIGIIGTGGMGTEHLRAFQRLNSAGRTDVQIVALCDVCRPRLEAAGHALREAGARYDFRYFTDYRELLRDASIQGVLIAAPEHWHAAMATLAIRAGRDVYIEKPMTLRHEDALRLRDVVAAHPERIVVVGTQYVTYPSYADAKRLIAEGKIGKPVFSQTSYCRNSKDGEWLYYEIDPQWQPGVNLDWNAWTGPLGRQPWSPEVYARWRRFRKYSTGIIGDLLVHRITPLMMALDVGWPIRIVASGGHYVDKAMENHDQVNINIEFENEHTMIVAGSTANEVGLETMIRGHRANLYLGDRRLTLRPERIYAEEVEEQTFEGEDLGDPQDLLRVRWIDAIRTRGPSPSPVDLGAQVMVVVDLASRSMWDGHAYAFDPRRLKARRI
ncbi:MAG TPA: Gfo/Idh/MocA family oxidoreductase [Longimicrobiales bacterium]|nr:Gfo/Idh/MocA family oxidoreductase [Longimicrobiales bacterium]